MIANTAVEIDGIRMLIGLVIGIALLIMLVLKTKVQTFLALIISTIVIGLIGGMPLTATDVVDAAGDARAGVSIINSITSGFGGTLGSIGIIIGFGVMIGRVFDISGAAKRMAYTFLKLFGKGREEEALALTGFLVSIPIFCDSGFIVLSPIAKALSIQASDLIKDSIKETKLSSSQVEIVSETVNSAVNEAVTKALKDLRFKIEH